MRVLGFALLGLGLLQMAGDVLGVPALRGLGAATGASPAPKVFSASRGLETYSSRFFLEWTDAQGREQSKLLDSEMYAGVRGPYNRRNTYGAVLAYAPLLASDPATQPMLESVSRYALCGEAPLLRELGLDPAEDRRNLRVRLAPRAGTHPDLPLVLEVGCP